MRKRERCLLTQHQMGPKDHLSPPPDPTGGGAAVMATEVEAKAVDNRS